MSNVSFAAPTTPKRKIANAISVNKYIGSILSGIYDKYFCLSPPVLSLPTSVSYLKKTIIMRANPNIPENNPLMNISWLITRPFPKGYAILPAHLSSNHCHTKHWQRWSNYHHTAFQKNSCFEMPDTPPG